MIKGTTGTITWWLEISVDARSVVWTDGRVSERFGFNTFLPSIARDLCSGLWLTFAWTHIRYWNWKVVVLDLPTHLVTYGYSHCNFILQLPETCGWKKLSVETCCLKHSAIMSPCAVKPEKAQKCVFIIISSVNNLPLVG